MKSTRFVASAVLALVLAASSVSAQTSTTASAGAQGLEKLKALEGQWIDVDGTLGKKGAVAVTYRVTSGGKTVVESFPVNSPFEMVTTYYLDGNDLVLTHYCADGTQPRMRSKGLSGQTLAFDYETGSNIDVAKTSHMHAAKFEFISADEIRAVWTNWTDGKPDPQHLAQFRIKRQK